MTLFFADLVREACLGTGIGDLALGGALPGHRAFAAVVPAGGRFHYCIAGVTRPEEWEIGEGVLGSGGSLVRMPLSSSAAGAAVDFSPGLKTVALVVAAAWFSGQEAGGPPPEIADVEGLTEALAGKAALADVEALTEALAGKAALAGASFAGAVTVPQLKVGSVKVVGARATGWAAPTGTASRAAFDTAGITAGQLAQRLKALIDDLTAHGLIGS